MTRVMLWFQLSAVHGIQSAFDEAMSYCRYHPSKGYWWHFKDQEERGGSAY
jgi:mediator of RNA polymerase II transcription subunit 6